MIGTGGNGSLHDRSLWRAGVRGGAPAGLARYLTGGQRPSPTKRARRRLLTCSEKRATRPGCFTRPRRTGRLQAGLRSRVSRKLFSYNVIDKQCLRLERALVERWVDEDGTVCESDWFVHCLLKANIPEGIAEQITAIGIDSTFLLAWAVPGAYSPDKESTDKPCSADVHARWGHRSATSKTQSR